MAFLVLNTMLQARLYYAILLHDSVVNVVNDLDGNDGNFTLWSLSKGNF